MQQTFIEVYDHEDDLPYLINTAQVTHIAKLGLLINMFHISTGKTIEIISASEDIRDKQYNAVAVLIGVQIL